MIGALDNPTSGKVLIDGKDIFAMKESKLTIFRRRNIGFIFQAFNLIPELTVEQNIIFPVLLDYQKPDKKYLEELLAVLNLKERRNYLPMSVSARVKQYGAMRAVGMESRQVTKMITAEAVTYAVYGTIAGTALGLILHYLIYVKIVISHFGGFWNIPFTTIGIVLLLVVFSCIIAVHGPTKRMRDMAITDTINDL